MLNGTVGLSFGGRGDKATASLEIPTQYPETDAEWQAFWAEKIKGGTVNDLAIADFDVKRQGSARTLFEKEWKAGKRGDELLAAVSKKFNDYTWTARAEGTPRTPRQVTVKGVDQKMLKGVSKEFLERLKAANVNIEGVEL